jgi:hypothetical protein
MPVPQGDVWAKAGSPMRFGRSVKWRLAGGQMAKRAGGLFRSEEEVDEDLSDDVLDGAVTDAGVEPVVVVRDIGEGVHACGGFFGQLVDLGFDVFGGLFGGHGSFRLF